MLRARPQVLGTALFSALGLVPLACGGTSTSSDDSAGSSQGASSTQGGSSATGGKPTTGGSKATGGRPGGGSPGVGGKASGGTGNVVPCADPIPVGNGFEQCGEGGPIHRPMVGECSSSLPRPDALPNPQEFDTCASDADCTEMPHGYCGSGQGNAPGAYCSYGCVKDAECGDGSICVCGEPVGRCVPSSCVSDADCGADFRCQSFDSSHGCGAVQFACQTADDTCASDADCLSAAAGQFCDATSGSFVCVPGGCAIGRPFLVEGCERVAPLAERADWLELELPLDIGAVPREVCLQAAEGWARVGQMEHASVAAFARFALQLLQLGAPPQLVEAAASAMSDETRHAKFAFAVASRYARRPIGPGQLDIERSLDGGSLLEVVRLVMREGCIGETAAALEAREIAEHVTAACLRASISRVAEDETRHAELAWRFVRWALEQQPVEVAEVVRAELARAESEPAMAARESTTEELALLDLGILPESLRGELRRAALRDVILPCGNALLAQAHLGLPKAQALSV